MVALTSLIPLLLFLSSETSAAGSHLPSHLDRSRIRSVHRRHHARRADTGCNNAVAVGGTPVAVGARASAVAVGNEMLVVPGNSTAIRNGTSAVLPNSAALIAGSTNVTSSTAETAVADTVKDAVEDVVSPALAKALSMANSGSQNTIASTDDANVPSNGIYVVDPSTVKSSQSSQMSAGNPVAQNAAASSPSPAAQVDANAYQAAPAGPAPSAAVTVCSQGDWLCDGMTLKQCNWNEWILIKQCSGDNIVCSDQGPAIGCVWTWSVAQQAAVSSPTISPSPAANSAPAVNPSPQSSSANTYSSVPTAVQNNAVVKPSQGVSSQPSSSAAQTSTKNQPTIAGLSTTPAPSASPGTSPMPTATFTMSNGEVCVEWEEDVWVEEDDDGESSSIMTMSMTSSVLSASSAAATPSVSSMATSSWTSTTSASARSTSTYPAPSASVSASASTSAQDDEDCEEWEDDNTSSGAASPTQLGHNLLANSNSTSGSLSSTSRSSSSVKGSSAVSSISSTTSTASTNSSSTHRNLTPVASVPSSSSVSASVSQVAATASPASASASPASATGSPASATGSPASVTGSPATSTSSSISDTQLAIAATVSASSKVLSRLTNPSKTLSVIDVSALSISTATLTTSASSGVITGSASGIATYTAPHYVIYADDWLFSMPDVSTLNSFNRFVLAFWMSNQGPVDNAQMWTWMSQSDRQATLDAYHKAGIALMVSAFGSTDQPTTWGKDPVQTAQDLAKFVIAYQFDGVDIDYEDMGAMNSNQAEAWLIPFQQELRRLLPSPYLISHAPVAPWFTSSNAYKSGAYVAVHQSVGDGIDFYNMQFYNQGDGVYTDCTTLITQSGGYWPGTSVMEMNSYAKVPLNKIVIGKPLNPDQADNGYMTPQALNTCVKLARTKGWNGGVMFWEWTTAAPGIMAAARA